MSSPNPSSKKRKADELLLDAAESERETCSTSSIMPPRLPATTWGDILDFMPYHEVRSALLISKAIANDAVQYVRTLNVFKGTEMNVPSARARFVNVESVNILCFIEYVYISRAGTSTSTALSSDVASRIIPFLSAFPKLKQVLVGGYKIVGRIGRKRVYHRNTNTIDLPNLIRGDGENRRLVGGLVDAFCGAFKTMMIPRDIDLIGLSIPLSAIMQCELARRRNSPPCAGCRGVCANFPLNSVYSMELCISDKGRFGIMANRPGGREYLRSKAPDRLTMFFRDVIGSGNVPPEDTDEARSLWQRLQQQGCDMSKLLVSGIQFISDRSFVELDKLIAYGFAPDAVTREQLYHIFSIGHYESRDYDVWIKSSFDRLVSRGFDLDGRDVVLLDELREPALEWSDHDGDFDVFGDGSDY
mmetsp:Transcript_22490/g.48836  ORF Transcript_22490/g.48836 Transcript_22490/m.48836 type:complete len:416 (+) Transcript_22490:104-1351(+)